MKKKRVLLNWLPPAKSSFPSPAMTVLKGALAKRGTECTIVYWNIILEDIMQEYYLGLDIDNLSDLNLLSIFFSAIAVESHDEDALLRQIMFLESLKPAYIEASFDFKKHIEKCVEKLDFKIKSVFTEYAFGDTLFCGFSMNLFQWVASSYIGRKLKATLPDVIQVIGGIGNAELSRTLLQVFPFFDLALWGEGEQSVCQVACSLETNGTLNKDDICHGYINNGGVIETCSGSFKYWPLDEAATYDYTDFFKVYSGNIEKIVMPIESSRGCHWNRCKFCFLNQGYVYRVKSVENLSMEIRKLIKKYGIQKFNFMDNDVIGRDHKIFREMLSSLKSIRDDYPEFSIHLAEIVSRNVNKDLIKEMSLAGFKHVQIGYESPSDQLLSKINKKNTFASNLLFCKWAALYHINIGGMNILEGLLDENLSDIQEGISNIRFQRFFKQVGKYNHSRSCLAINKVSRYFKEVPEMVKTLDIYYDPIRTNLPCGYIPYELEWNVYHFMRAYQNPAWGTFHMVDRYYETNSFSYTLTTDGASIIYSEFLNQGLVKELEFTIDSIEWRVLCECNEKVVTLEDLVEILQSDLATLKDTVFRLRHTGLLYYSNVTSECVTVINTSNII